MRKIILATIASLFFFSFAQAVDVVCSCKGEEKCSDVRISITDTNSPGTYMTVEYAYGERNLEGFAQVLFKKEEGETFYYLRNFLLAEKDGSYRLPMRPATCN